MEITPVSYIQITFINSEEGNEIADFMDFIKRAYIESRRPGLKNTFEKDREILRKLTEGLNIKIPDQEVQVNAGQTQ